MRRFKLFFAAFAMILSTAAFANSKPGIEDKNEPIKHHLQQVLMDSELVIEEDFTAKVIFQVTKENRIEIKLIDSPNEEVNNFLWMRLANKKLYGNSWESEKVYELPVKVHASK